MDCEAFRRDYPRFRTPELAAPAYKAWVEHLHGCADCGEWFQTEEVRARGIDLATFPCVHLAYYTSAWLGQGGAGVAIVHQAKFDEFGIHLYDKSVIGIRHCPWCGIKLAASRREEWFKALAQLGFDDPLAQDIPVQFTTAVWWRKG
ncbi:MAG TPA: hypothetical protein VMZ28_30225 [Kofleriaceae bacterium]|nr:hypothetical protein [Kofleriaceae bacterium]